jgi:hypothetical protein
MRRKPTQQAPLKFVMRYCPGHGMAGMWNQPELHMVRRSGGNEFGMMRRDAPVFFTMNQQNRY